MGRKSIAENFLGKKVGGIRILKKLDIRDGRLFVQCECLKCKKKFEAKFHNVYKGSYKSCGCGKFQIGEKNYKWKGVGLISASYFFSLKKGAKERNLNFEITLDEIWELFKKQDGKCALSGKQLNFNSTRKRSDGNASLDRKDSKIGYIINNVQWVDKKINMSKQGMSNEEFINMCKEIYEHSK